MKDEPRQVILMRTDIKMTKGKMCAQAAHASLKVILDHQHDKIWSAKNMWLQTSYAKIVLRVNSEEELVDIIDRAKYNKLHTSLIVDSGRTIFNGVPTITCGAIGPEWPNKINSLTGHLKLL